jgi:hypothetical protein
MRPRVAASVLAGALIRQAESAGGFAAVLSKGDPTAGAILLILLEKGLNPQVLERILRADGSYSWQITGGQASENPEEVPELVARRRRSDPDLWVLELDIPSRERFIAELGSFD